MSIDAATRIHNQPAIRLARECFDGTVNISGIMHSRSRQLYAER
jgi:hypothetical protein